MGKNEIGKGSVSKWLRDDAVVRAAKTVRSGGRRAGLDRILELARALSAAAGDSERERMLRAELLGYEKVGLEVPEERRVAGFASPFPVRAIGLLEPEEIFLANREKFSQVTLTIGQPVKELEIALSQIEHGGVLALRVPASEVSGEAATTDLDVEVYIYILPREIERVITSARQKALDAVLARVVDGALGSEPPADITATMLAPDLEGTEHEHDRTQRLEVEADAKASAGRS
ncbi:MAG: hypothetical protein HYV07_01075 [Deltaproteobacteria bacterium]|nr:hypothetical protein [Deltaproteobacteria bacterium]